MAEFGNHQPSIAMKTARKAAKGSVVMFIGDTTSSVVSLLASVFIARLLGPSDYGLYSIVLSAMYLMVLFTDFGINSALVRFIARSISEDPDRPIRKTAIAGTVFELVTGLAVFSISLFFANVLATHVMNRPSLTPLVQMASPAIIGSVLLAVSGSIFVGLDEMSKKSIMSFLGASTKLVVAIVLLLLGYGVSGAIAGHVFSLVIPGALGTFIILRKSARPESWSDIHSGMTSDLLHMIKYGAPLYLSTIIADLLTRFRTIVLSWFTSNIEIGNFAVTIVFSSIVALITTPISTTLFPAFSKFDPNRQSSDLRNFFVYSLRYTLLLVIPISFLVAAASRDLISTFYGQQFAGAASYLAVYSTTFLPAGFSLVLGALFSGIGRTDVSLRAALIQVFCAIPLYIVFTNLLGVVGLICATTVSAILPAAYLARVGQIQYGLELDSRQTIRILLASVLSSLPVLALDTLPYLPVVKLTLSAIVFGTVYVTAIPIVGGLKYEDITNLRQISKDMKLVSSLSELVLSYDEKILCVAHPSHHDR